MKSVLQDWVMNLGLRHQGVLLTAVRGCDTVPRKHESKDLVRAFRAMILNAHVGDPKKSVSFIEVFSIDDLQIVMDAVVNSHDELPHHYIMHLVHASEIVGYYYPGPDSHQWIRFYNRMCRKFHMNPETKEQLDTRLNADETTFKYFQEN